MNLARRHEKMMIATRLRQLSSLFWEKRLEIYKTNNLQFRPNWGTVAYLVKNDTNISINDIASELGFAHTSVLKIVKDMITEGYMVSVIDKNDARRKILSLTEKGIHEQKKMNEINQIVRMVNEEILKDTGLLEAVSKVEAKLDGASFYERFKEKARQQNL